MIRKVSIIIPVHKTTSFLKECIESALNQSHESIEIIVVCNGDLTTQDCATFINDSSDKLIYIHSDSGRAEARTKGMQIAIGDYLQFLDFDDLLYPEKISRQLQAIEASNINEAVSVSQWDLIEHSLEHKVPFNNDFLFTKSLISGIDFYRLLGKHKGHIMTAAWLIPKSFIDSQITWTDSPNDDAVFISELLKPNTPIVMVPKRLAAYRTHDANTHHIRSRQEFDKLILAWESIANNLIAFEDQDVYKYFYNAYIYLIKYSVNIRGYKIVSLYKKFLHFGFKARIPIINLIDDHYLLLKKIILRIWRKIV